MELAKNDNTRVGRVIAVATGDAALLRDLRAVAEAESLEVFAVEPGGAILERAKTLQPAAVVLDVRAADTEQPDGAKALDALKSGAYTAALPVIVALPGGAGDEEEMALFERGADDCVPYTAHPDLARARARAVLRRWCPPAQAADRLAVDGLTLELSARKTTVNGTPVALTRKEFDLLNMLLRRRGTVVYTTQLYHTVWGQGGGPADAHTVKVHVSSLRGKLGGELGRKIVNLPGLGYRFDG